MTSRASFGNSTDYRIDLRVACKMTRCYPGADGGILDDFWASCVPWGGLLRDSLLFDPVKCTLSACAPCVRLTRLVGASVLCASVEGKAVAAEVGFFDYFRTLTGPRDTLPTSPTYLLLLLVYHMRYLSLTRTLDGGLRLASNGSSPVSYRRADVCGRRHVPLYQTSRKGAWATVRLSSSRRCWEGCRPTLKRGDDAVPSLLPIRHHVGTLGPGQGA